MLEPVHASGDDRTIRLAALLAMVLLAGCVSPNTYSTPRTVQAGKMILTAATEFSDVTTNSPKKDSDDIEYMPWLPTVIFRLGVADATDVGLASKNFSSFGVDVKHTLVRGRFDLAIDPALQLFGYPTDRNNEDLYFVAGHLPLLFGLNISRSFSLVGAVGATLTASDTYGVEDTTLLTDAASDEVVMARGTLGFDWRITQSVAIHPEATVLHGFQYSTTGVVAGIGISFGALPSYADIDAP
jgi:hypothetical protein